MLPQRVLKVDVRQFGQVHAPYHVGLRCHVEYAANSAAPQPAGEAIATPHLQQQTQTQQLDLKSYKVRHRVTAIRCPTEGVAVGISVG
jgi:hypothetical protein